MTAKSQPQDELFHLRALVLMGEKVVEDFLPNIGKCALQDYGRLNEFLIEAAKVRKTKVSP
jgi:hypothetical protein